MSGASFALLAGAVVAATPTTPLPWFEFSDYPMKAFEKKAEGVTQFELLVAPDGRVAGCTITATSGNAELDKTTCNLATRRVKFQPARGPEGHPVYGVYRSLAVWTLPDRTIAASPGPDLEVSLNKFPAGTAQPPVVKLAYSLDTQGHPSSCTLMPSSLKQPALLVEVGCKELMARMAGKRVLGPGGQPVPVVSTAAVRFNAGS